MLQCGPKTDTSDDPLLVALIEEHKTRLYQLNTNSERAAHLYVRYFQTYPKQKTPTSNEIEQILKQKGFTDKFDPVAFVRTSLSLLWGLLINSILPHILSMWTISTNLANGPGIYARSLTANLALKTASLTIPPNHVKLKQYINLMVWFVAVSAYLHLIPSLKGVFDLGKVFNLLPEEIDPKTYADEYVPALAKNYGNITFEALAIVAMLSLHYGPNAMAILMRHLSDNKLLTAADEFCTLIRGGDDADDLIREHPEAATTLVWNMRRRSAVTEPIEDDSSDFEQKSTTRMDQRKNG